MGVGKPLQNKRPKGNRQQKKLAFLFNKEDKFF
jgi:hypothetical protein